MLIEQSELLLFFLVVGVAAYYLVLPVLVGMQQRYSANPKVMELNFERLDPSLAEFLMTRTRALFAIGFEEPTLVQLPSPAANVSVYLILLVNRQAGDKAMVTAMVGHGSVPIQSLYVEFSTRFDDDHIFNTLNASQLNAFPPSPTTVRTQVPTVSDPQELYQLHCFVMDNHDVRANKVLYEPGKAIEYLIRFAFREAYDRQVKRGWLYYDEAKDCYGQTFVGAYRIAWGLMQPFKALRTNALRRREQMILADFRRTRAG